MRMLATGGGVDIELLWTETRFCEVRDRKGGGGMVDLVMHLFRANFRKAVAELLARGP